MKKTSIILFLIGCIGTISAQNVGINATGAAPHSSAGLDVNFTDKGFLIPRVALTALNSASPVSSPTVSLLVYNTATAGSSPNNVLPGYYYWNGTVWVAISGHGGRDWSLLGNAGTNASSNFLGTTDAVDLVFGTNNQKRMFILSTGEVGIGTSPAAKLHVTSTTTNPVLFENSTADADVFMELKGTVSGRRGSVTNLFDIGINAASSYAELQAYNSSGTYLYTILNKNGGNVGIGTTSPTYKLSVAGGIAVGPTYASTSGYSALISAIFEDKVGIGTTGPTEQLQITQNFRMPATTSSTVGVIMSDANRFIHNYGTDNAFFGTLSGNFTMSGSGNVGIGSSVLFLNTSGSSNTAIGYYALYGNGAGVCNVANGYNALYSNSTGGNNTAIGYRALYANGIGSNNTAEGREAMYANQNGSQNTASGYLAMYANVDGSYNTASGYQALKLNVSGALNTAVGVEALYSNTASFNTAIGRQALYLNTSGTENTSAGVYSLFNNSSGSYNAAWGNGALFSVTTASNNTAVGYGADVSGGGSNSTGVGSGAVANAANKIRLGNGAVTVVEGPVAYTVSDGRFKYDISEIDVKGLEFIKRLRPVVYNFNAQQFQEFLTQHLPDSIRKKHFNGIDYDKATIIRQSGFIAQEVEQAMKESGYNFNGVHVPENENDNYSLAYGQFVVPIIKAMQEQQQTIENQQAIIKVLTEKNKNLQETVSNIEVENKTNKANYDKRLKALEEIMGVRAQK